MPKGMPAWGFILVTCHLLLSPSQAVTHVSNEEASLLAAEPEPLRCFSRQFEDLTCFWDEVEEEDWAKQEAEGGQEDRGPYQLFFAYPGEEPQVCPLSSQRLPNGGLRHVCQIQPAEGMRLFAKLTLWVWDPANRRNRTQRVLSLENVDPVLSPPSPLPPHSESQNLKAGKDLKGTVHKEPWLQHTKQWPANLCLMTSKKGEPIISWEGPFPLGDYSERKLLFFSDIQPKLISLQLSPFSTAGYSSRTSLFHGSPSDT